MGNRPSRSLRHEYELFVEREIENYKESVPRSTLLKVGDEAVASLAAQSQLALTELVLCEEVDRIIRARLRLPTYQTWRRRRVKEVAELRRPERWGLTADHVIVREVHPSADGRVLVAGAAARDSALFLAANGCEVTAIDEEADAVLRVLEAAEAVGLGDRIELCACGLGRWIPADPLIAVICSLDALATLSPTERDRVIDVLKTATRDGGVHLVETIAAGSNNGGVLDDLRTRYSGWTISIESAAEGNGGNAMFLARKTVA